MNSMSKTMSYLNRVPHLRPTYFTVARSPPRADGEIHNISHAQFAVRRGELQCLKKVLVCYRTSGPVETVLVSFGSTS